MDVDTLYQRIYDASPKPVKVRVQGDRKAYESLRTALVKKNTEMNLIDGNESLCATWHEETKVAEFWRAKRRRATRPEFTILD